MKAVLYILLPQDAEGELQFAQETSNGLELVNSRSAFGTPECIAFAPSVVTGHFRLPIPARNETEAARAALFAIEDELAQPVEDVHVVLGPRGKDSSERDIYIVDRSLMTSWIDLLSKTGLSQARIIPEQCLFTDIEETVDLGNHLLQLQGNRILGIDASLPEPALEALAVSSDTRRLQKGAGLIRLAERSSRYAGVNLRTGAFARERQSNPQTRTWRKAAGIAVAAASVWTGTLILEARNYNHATEQLMRRAEERYAAIFPNAVLPADMNRATRDMLAASTRPDSLNFRTSVAALYEAIAVETNTQIKALTFTSENNRLSADIITPGTAAAEDIAVFLHGRGFQVVSQPQGNKAGSQTTTIIVEPEP